MFVVSGNSVQAVLVCKSKFDDVTEVNNEIQCQLNSTKLDVVDCQVERIVDQDENVIYDAEYRIITQNYVIDEDRFTDVGDLVHLVNVEGLFQIIKINNHIFLYHNNGRESMYADNFISDIVELRKLLQQKHPEYISYCKL